MQVDFGVLEVPDLTWLSCPSCLVELSVRHSLRDVLYLTFQFPYFFRDKNTFSNQSSSDSKLETNQEKNDENEMNITDEKKASSEWGQNGARHSDSYTDSRPSKHSEPNANPEARYLYSRRFSSVSMLKPIKLTKARDLDRDVQEHGNS